MFSIKRVKRHFPLGLILAIFYWAPAAMGQFTFHFDENGIGTFQFGTSTFPLQSLGKIADPIDPNGLLPLAYDIKGSTTRVPIDGDVNVLDSTGLLSDLLRFENGLLLIYSDLNEPGDPMSLADTGFAGFRQSNLVTLQETGPDPGLNGLFPYTSSATGPGSISAPTAYYFTSDSPVPEPNSLAVLGLIVSPCVLMRPRRR